MVFSRAENEPRRREERKEKTRILANACPSFFEGCVLRVKKMTRYWFTMDFEKAVESGAGNQTCSFFIG
jgi:hypothetical protein